MTHLCSRCLTNINKYYGEYCRAWNVLRNQAAVAKGYYCPFCGIVDFEISDLDKWLSEQPSWIVKIKDIDKYREKQRMNEKMMPLEVEKLRMELVQMCLDFMSRVHDDSYVAFAVVERNRIQNILNANAGLLQAYKQTMTLEDS